MRMLFAFLVVFGTELVPLKVNGQSEIRIGFDCTHGQNIKIAEGWNTNLFDNSAFEIIPLTDPVRAENIRQYKAMVIFSPTIAFTKAEVKTFVNYLRQGGSLLVIFDEERRTPLNVGINNIIEPFGLSLTDNIPVRHNCGAITTSDSVVCKGIRELPFSGGRSVKGGKVISRVYDEGEYVHTAYQNLKKGNKLVVMSDGMAGLLLGSPEGIRFSGTGPSDSKYWGKDSEVFIREIMEFLTID